MPCARSIPHPPQHHPPQHHLRNSFVMRVDVVLCVCTPVQCRYDAELLVLPVVLQRNHHNYRIDDLVDVGNCWAYVVLGNFASVATLSV
jgi:hypothetical protein